MSAPILTGVRVLDFGRYIAGPYCAALLAELGAEVIRIEPTGGGDDRFVMPVTAQGEGAMYIQVNRNKRSLVLNLDKPESGRVVRRLIASADVVIANLVPALLKKLGLDYETLRGIRDDIILTSISAFDPTGPQKNSPGFDGTGQASSGAMYLTGTVGHPLRSAVSYVDYSTALASAYGTMAALLAKAKTGKGQHVQASLMSTALTMTNMMLIEEASGARTRVPSGNRSPISGPNDLFATQDGWLLVQIAGQDMFERWAALVGKTELVADPRFADDISRGENGAELSAIMNGWCGRMTSAQVLEALRGARIPGCTVLTPAEALAQQRAQPDGSFDWHTRAGLETIVPVARAPVRMTMMSTEPMRAAPVLGADTDEILSSLGFDTAEIAALRTAGAV